MKSAVYEDRSTKTATAPTRAKMEKMDKTEMMKKAEAAGSPGPEHKTLEQFVGEWKCAVKCWMDPNGPPNESQGTAKANWIMKGRFLQEDFQGDMMGRPFQGRMLVGYNKLKQKFQSVWIDDMNTSMFTTEGKGDQKVITLEGPASCPATGRTDIPMKVVLTTINPKKHTLEMFDGSQGNARTMEITYTRQ